MCAVWCAGPATWPLSGTAGEWTYADLCDGAELRAALQGVDAVCHCAALTRALDEETFLRVNTQGTEALARAGLEAVPELRRFLFVSSVAAAGPSDGPGDVVDEARPPRPVTWYGKSKLAAEQALQAMVGEGDGRLPVTIVRPAAVYGPRDKDFYAYFRAIKLHLCLQLGRDERHVSLIHVCDLVDLLVQALEQEQAVGQTYFGCGPATTYAELAKVIACALDSRSVRINIPLALLGPMATASTVKGRLTGRPGLLNEQRLVDVRQRSWLFSGKRRGNWVSRRDTTWRRACARRWNGIAGRDGCSNVFGGKLRRIWLTVLAVSNLVLWLAVAVGVGLLASDEMNLGLEKYLRERQATAVALLSRPPAPPAGMAPINWPSKPSLRVVGQTPEVRWRSPTAVTRAGRDRPGTPVSRIWRAGIKRAEPRTLVSSRSYFRSR